MYNVGDLVFDTATGASVQVLEKIEAWGYVSYRVFNLATGAVYKATGEQLNMDGGTNTYAYSIWLILLLQMYVSLWAECLKHMMKSQMQC